MAKRICLLTGYETNCNDGCYNCGCGGEVAFNNCYVSIYDVQRVCDIVKHIETVSTEGEEIAEYMRNELERMVVERVREEKSVDAKEILKHLDSLMICVGNAYNTSHYLLKSDMEFIEKQEKIIKELLSDINDKGD